MTLISAAHQPPAPWPRADSSLAAPRKHDFQMSAAAETAAFCLSRTLIPLFLLTAALGLWFLPPAIPISVHVLLGSGPITSGSLPLPLVKLSFLDLECQWGNHAALQDATINSLSQVSTDLLMVLHCHPSSILSALCPVLQTGDCQPPLSSNISSHHFLVFNRQHRVPLLRK